MKNAFETVRPQGEEKPSARPPRHMTGRPMGTISARQARANQVSKPVTTWAKPAPPWAWPASRAAAAPGEHKPRATGRTAQIRQLLQTRGPMDSTEIMQELNLPSRALVGALLGSDLRAGRAVHADGKYRWCASTDLNDEAGGAEA